MQSLLVLVVLLEAQLMVAQAIRALFRCRGLLEVVVVVVVQTQQAIVVGVELVALPLVVAVVEQHKTETLEQVEMVEADLW
jgi:type IV secretory pathway TrbD component